MEIKYPRKNARILNELHPELKTSQCVPTLVRLFKKFQDYSILIRKKDNNRGINGNRNFRGTGNVPTPINTIIAEDFWYP